MTARMSMVGKTGSGMTKVECSTDAAVTGVDAVAVAVNAGRAAEAER